MESSLFIQLHAHNGVCYFRKNAVVSVVPANGLHINSAVNGISVKENPEEVMAQILGDDRQTAEASEK